METKYCTNCGKSILPGEFRNANGQCGECAAKAQAATQPGQAMQYSDKDWLVTLLFSIFLGCLGIHRFYVGKIGTGVLWTLTAGMFGIGWIVDIFTVASGNFYDSSGYVLRAGGPSSDTQRAAE